MLCGDGVLGGPGLGLEYYSSPSRVDPTPDKSGSRLESKSESESDRGQRKRFHWLIYLLGSIIGDHVMIK